MARVLIPVDSTDATVTRLIVKGVIEQLLAHLSFKNIQDIIYIERGNIAATQSMNAENEVVKLATDNYIEVTYKERTVEGAFDITQFQEEYPYIFACKKLGVYITPTYLKSELELTITYKAKSYNQIRKWLDNYHRLMNTNTGSFLHNVLYNYTIPIDIVNYIYSIQYLSENKAPYGDTLSNFLDTYFADGLLVRSSLNIASKAIALNNRQNACLGLITAPPEEIEVSTEPPINELTFTYIVKFDKVDTLALDFQCYIHNQRVDTTPLLKYSDRRYHQNPKEGYLTASENALTSINGQSVSKDYYDRTFKNRTNECNSWLPPTITAVEGEETLYVYPTHVNELDLREICDIDDLLIEQFPQTLIDICKKYPDYISNPTFPINIEYWSVCSNPFKIDINMDATGKIVSSIDLNLRCRYYLRIYLNRNIDCAGLEYMQNDPSSIRLLLEYVKAEYNLTTIGNDSWVTMKSLCEAIDIFSKRLHRRRFKTPLVLKSELTVSRGGN